MTRDIKYWSFYVLVQTDLQNNSKMVVNISRILTSRVVDMSIVTGRGTISIFQVSLNITYTEASDKALES